MTDRPSCCKRWPFLSCVTVRPYESRQGNGMISAHRFGGNWTAAKLTALKDYLAAYTTALKGIGFTLHYVDAFAGSGSFVPKNGGNEQAGSALLALGMPGFAKYHFIEKSAGRCRRLRELAASQGKADAVHVVEGDANAYLAHLCNRPIWKRSRAVVFLDPYGMQVEWATLEAIAATGAIDVWYLFPLSGVTRQLTLDESNMDDDKRNALDRVLGTGDWRTAFYEEGRTGDMFGAANSVERHADTGAIEKWVTARLATLFPVVEGPEVLRRGHAGRSDGGPRLFALYFLASSTNPKAKALARRLAGGVLTKLRREQA